MLSAAQEFAKLFRLPAAEAVTYLQERRRLTPTYSWQDLWHEEHASQFTVSRLTRLDLLQAVQDGITKSVQGDMQRRDWMRDTKKLLKEAGWWGEVNVLDPATGDALSTRFDKPRLKLIFDVNTRVAYNAGYWERAWRNRATHPYVEYLTMDDDKVREGHRRWHKLVLPIDHPFWATHWPPNGFRCRCRVRSMTAAEFERRMKAGEITDIAPEDVTIEWVNKRTGQVSQVPDGVQPGFDYNPGLNRTINTGLQKAVSNKLAAVSKPLANAAMADGFDDGFKVARTVKEAADWAVEKNLADYVDYKTIKPEVANAWNKSLYDHLREFPALRKNQVFTGTAQAQMARWRSINVERYIEMLRKANPHLPDYDFRPHAERAIPAKRIPSDTYAISWDQPDVRGVAINAKWGKDPEALKNALAKDVASGFHPISCDTIRSVVDHELGHQIDSLLGLSLDADVVRLYNEAKLTGIKEEVSVYAATNINEFIAECWAESCNNPTPRFCASRVAEIVRKRYADKFPSF